MSRWLSSSRYLSAPCKLADVAPSAMCAAMSRHPAQHNLIRVRVQRTVLFLAAHMAPVTAVVLSIPALCRWMGQPLEVCELMLPCVPPLPATVRATHHGQNVISLCLCRYILISLPGVWLDTIDRPMNRMLIAQSIARPQMWISGFGASRLLLRESPVMRVHGDRHDSSKQCRAKRRVCACCAVLILHFATNHLFFNILGWDYLAAAVAFTLSRFYYFILQAAYIHRAGLGPRVWGKPSCKALSNWGKFAALAYPSAAMRCMESFCYSGMTVISGDLISCLFATLGLCVGRTGP